MSDLKEFTFNGQKISLFSKTKTTASGNKAYDIAVKKAIVNQYCILRRNPLCSQTKALEVLGTAHGLSPSTVKNWYDRYGNNIVSPGLTKKPKVIKPIKLPAPVNTDMGAVLESAAKVISKTSDKSLSKILEIIKALPKVEIMISITPKDS